MTRTVFKKLQRPLDPLPINLQAVAIELCPLSLRDCLIEAGLEGGALLLLPVREDVEKCKAGALERAPPPHKQICDVVRLNRDDDARSLPEDVGDEVGWELMLLEDLLDPHGKVARKPLLCEGMRCGHAEPEGFPEKGCLCIKPPPVPLLPRSRGGGGRLWL